MDPLIFIGIIVIFSILDSVARKKKRTGVQAPEAPPRREREPARTAQRQDAPTYVDYDELGIEEEEEEEARRAHARPTSSETLVPKDVWEEIAGLMTTAQQSRTTKPRGTPSSRSRTPAPRRAPPRRPARPARPVQPALPPEADVSHGRAVMPGDRVHLSHREYGTDPSLRSRSEQDGLDPLARSLGADEAVVRQQLRGHSRRALRQAVILQEVLGPPAALRPDRFPD